MIVVMVHFFNVFSSFSAELIEIKWNFERKIVGFYCAFALYFLVISRKIVLRLDSAMKLTTWFYYSIDQL